METTRKKHVDFDRLPARSRKNSKDPAHRDWIFWAAGLGLLIGIIGLCLVWIERAKQPKASEISHALPEAPPAVGDPVLPNGSPPNPMEEPPRERPAPGPVNDFLREEFERNATRCIDLSRNYQLEVTPSFSVSLLKPEWDFRQPTREVIWFYAYRAGQFGERPLTVFGVVDGLGKPLFQHPSLAGDTLALLDSEYTQFRWVGLDEPRLALIAAMVNAKPDASAVLDLYLVDNGEALGRRTWRYADPSFQEKPERSPELIALCDMNDDGRRDLCSLIFEIDGDSRHPDGGIRLFDPTKHTFASDPIPHTDKTLAQMTAYFDQVSQGILVPNVPTLIRPPSTERLFPNKTETPSEGEPAQEETSSEAPDTE